MKCGQQDNQDLSLITHSTTEASRQANFSFWLSCLWRSMERAMAVNNEPHVWQRRDRQGETFYSAHDPSTGRSIYCANEDEVRIWLDQLPYWSTGGRL